MGRNAKKKQALIRTLIRRIWSHLALYFKKKGVRFSLMTALFLTIACYFANNLPLLPGDPTLQYISSLYPYDLLGWHKNIEYGHVAFYNTSYDIATVPAVEYHNTNYPDTVGQNAITDRKKLSIFLDLLQKSDKYKFVIIDLIFDDSDRSQYDDYLYDKIIGMRDIVVANGDNLAPKLHQHQEIKKDATASYYITNSNTGFERWEYTHNDLRSIPMFVYESLHPTRKMTRFGIGRFSLYFSEHHLCQNANFLLFDNLLTNNNRERNESIDSLELTESDYVNIGSFLNSPTSDSERLNELAAYTDSAIVIIGNFTNDIHDTYMGTKPGPLIIARALQTLEERKNWVSFEHTCMWFCVFFLISFFIYNDHPISMYVPIIKKIPYKFFHMVLSLISFTLVLMICSFIEYAFFDRVYSLVVPVLFFTILKLVIQYRKFDTE